VKRLGLSSLFTATSPENSWLSGKPLEKIQGPFKIRAVGPAQTGSAPETTFITTVKLLFSQMFFNPSTDPWKTLWGTGMHPPQTLDTKGTSGSLHIF
jgi:hypothetical protein